MLGAECSAPCSWFGKVGWEFPSRGVCQDTQRYSVPAWWQAYVNIQVKTPSRGGVGSQSVVASNVSNNIPLLSYLMLSGACYSFTGHVESGCWLQAQGACMTAPEAQLDCLRHSRAPQDPRSGRYGLDPGCMSAGKQNPSTLKGCGGPVLRCC